MTLRSAIRLMAAGAWVLAAGTTAPAQDRRAGCSVEVSSIPATEKSARARARVFRASRILDLRFRVVFGAQHVFGADDTIEIKVLSPNGHVYQSFTVPVSDPQDGASDAPVERALPGYPFPVRTGRVQREKRAPGADGTAVDPLVYVDAPRFPVGGTQISTSSLYGVWRVEAAPSRSGGACAATFAIRP